MPHIDQIALGLILAGLVASVVDHWRGGQRGSRLAALTFVSFFGVGLVAMMAGHCADIIYNIFLLDWGSAPVGAPPVRGKGLSPPMQA